MICIEVLKLPIEAPFPAIDDVERVAQKLIACITAQSGGTFPAQKQHFTGWTVLHFACALGMGQVASLIIGLHGILCLW